MTDTPIKLVSFVICPFVQRSLITLLYKKQPYEIEYIDLENKPDWFLAKVPTGKVPALFLGDDVLFESAAINEYLDETTPNQIMSSEPIEKAKARGKIAFADQLIFNQFRMTVTSDQETFEKEKKSIYN